MRSAADGIREARDAMAEAGAVSGAFGESLGLSEEQAEQFERALENVQDETIASARSLSHLRSMIDEVGDEAAGSIPPLSAFNNEVQDTVDNAAASAASLHAFQSRIDEAGDEAALAALKTSGLSAAMLAVGSTSGAASAAMTAFNASASTTTLVAAALVAAITALGAAFGGLAIAIGAAAAGLAALFGGGLLYQGERLARQSEDIESTWEGIEQILSRVAGVAREALAPLQTPEFAAFALGALEDAVRLLGNMATSIARVSGPLLDLADTISSAFWNQTPEFLAQMEMTVLELKPILEDLGIWLARAIPDAIGVLRNTFKKLAPSVGNVLTQIVDLLPPLIDLGVRVLRIVLPPLQALIAALDALLNAVNYVTAALDPFLPLWRALFDIISSVFSAVGMVTDALTNLVQWIQGGIGDLIQFKSIMEGIAWAAQAAAAAVSNLASALTGGGGGLVGRMLGQGIPGVTPEVGEKLGSTLGNTMFEMSQRGSVEERTAEIRSQTNNRTINIGTIDASGTGQSETSVDRQVRKAVNQALAEEKARESGMPE